MRKIQFQIPKMILERFDAASISQFLAEQTGKTMPFRAGIFGSGFRNRIRKILIKGILR